MKYNDYELFYMVGESEEALTCLIKKYEPLFKKLSYFFIRKFPNNGLDVDDLMQQCRITTCCALDKFNDQNGVLFYSFLLVCLKRALSNYIRKSFNKELNYMDFENYEIMDEFSVCEDSCFNVLDREFERNIIDFKYKLSFVDSCIFELRYNGFSYKEIAILLDIKDKKVDNSLLKTRKKLEKYLLFQN